MLFSRRFYQSSVLFNPQTTIFYIIFSKLRLNLKKKTTLFRGGYHISQLLHKTYEISLRGSF